MNHEYEIRDVTSEDIPFIYGTFLNSYQTDSVLGKTCRKGIFFDHYKLVVDGILERSNIKVACHKTMPNVIYGYLISEGTILHYAFTKESFRRLGIATALLYSAAERIAGPFGFTYTTHKTFTGDQCDIKIPFNPFLLFAGVQQGDHNNGK